MENSGRNLNSRENTFLRAEETDVYRTFRFVRANVTCVGSIRLENASRNIFRKGFLIALLSHMQLNLHDVRFVTRAEKVSIRVPAHHVVSGLFATQVCLAVLFSNIIFYRRWIRYLDGDTRVKVALPNIYLSSLSKSTDRAAKMSLCNPCGTNHAFYFRQILHARTRGALLLSRYVKAERGGVSTILAMRSWFEPSPDLFQRNKQETLSFCNKISDVIESTYVLGASRR